jgi:predicted phosphodiesterase
VKIDFCSDLHVDAWHHETKLHDPSRPMFDELNRFIHIDWEILKTEDARVLVIAGDTANTMPETAIVASQAAAFYEYVILVDGNHEHYLGGETVSNNMNLLKILLSGTPNVKYLTHMSDPFVLDGIAFIGATGWYDWKAYESRGISEIAAKQAWRMASNDSRYPGYSELGDPQKIAFETSINLTEQVKKLTIDSTVQEIVVTTHMSPDPDLMEWKPNNQGWNLLTPSYVNTSLKNVLAVDSGQKITNWIYGHTHSRQIKKIGHVTYVNNARGYPRENAPFQLTHIEVGTK